MGLFIKAGDVIRFGPGVIFEAGIQKFSRSKWASSTGKASVNSNHVTFSRQFYWCGRNTYNQY